MCRSMVDIQSATAEIRPGKKREKKKQDKNIMSASATQGGHNKILYGLNFSKVFVIRYDTINYTVSPKTSRARLTCIS